MTILEKTAFSELIKSNGLTVTEHNPPVYCWVDIETTGLSRSDVILELGLVLTDEWGQVIPDAAYSSVVYEDGIQYNNRLTLMSDFVREMHESSGLLAEIRHGYGLSREDAEFRAIDFLKLWAKPGELFFAGSSVHFDTARVEEQMPDLFRFNHYRQLNVSSFKIAAQTLNPPVEKPKIDMRHRSLPDCACSINEWRHYIDNFLMIPGVTDDGQEFPIPAVTAAS